MKRPQDKSFFIMALAVFCIIYGLLGKVAFSESDLKKDDVSKFTVIRCQAPSFFTKEVQQQVTRVRTVTRTTMVPHYRIVTRRRLVRL